MRSLEYHGGQTIWVPEAMATATCSTAAWLPTRSSGCIIAGAASTKHSGWRSLLAWSPPDDSTEEAALGLA